MMLGSRWASLMTWLTIRSTVWSM